jgi:hypothetical protein
MPVELSTNLNCGVVGQTPEQGISPAPPKKRPCKHLAARFSVLFREELQGELQGFATGGSPMKDEAPNLWMEDLLTAVPVGNSNSNILMV